MGQSETSKDHPTFASLGARKRGVRAECPICRNRTEGTVQIQLSSRLPGKKPSSVASMSKRLCERHAVELYRALDAAWDAFLENASR